MKYKLTNLSATNPVAIGKWLISPSSYIVVDEWDLNYAEHWNQVNDAAFGALLTIEPYFDGLAVDLGSGAAAVWAGMAAEEAVVGGFHTTRFIFTNAVLPLVDAAGVTAHANKKIYDFPAGYLYMQSALVNLTFTADAAGVNDNYDGDVGLGTTAENGTATPLATTEQDILPNTAIDAGTTDKIGVAVGVSTGTEHAILDGHSSAKDLYLNVLVDDADHDVTTTPTNLLVNGSIIVNWIFMGDN